MASYLNIENIGRPVCLIKNGNLNGKFVYVASKQDKEHAKHKLKTFTIEEPAQFVLSCDEKKERVVIYISGSAGSGKSYFINEYINNSWRKLKKNKDKKIYLFSQKKEDTSLDSIRAERIIIDNSIYEDPLDFSLFENSMLIFDDIDNLPKKQKQAVYTILNDACNIGRSLCIDVICTNHQPTDRDCRIVLNTATFIIYFPGGSKKIDYLLKEYVGMTSSAIRTIKETESRWCVICKDYPQIAICQNFITLLSEID